METCKPGPAVRDNPWGHLLPPWGPDPLPRVGVSGWPRPCPRLCLTWSPGEVAATLVRRRAGQTQVHTPWCDLGPKCPLGTVVPLRVSTARDFGWPLWALPHLPSPRPPGGIREPLLLDCLGARGLISPASRPVGPLPCLCQGPTGIPHPCGSFCNPTTLPRGFLRLWGSVVHTRGGGGRGRHSWEQPRPNGSQSSPTRWSPGAPGPSPAPLPVLPRISAQVSCSRWNPSLRVCSQPQAGLPREPPAPLPCPLGPR